MTDIAVIVLTKNEEQHIGRCLARGAALSPRQTLSSTAPAGYAAIINDKIGLTCFIILHHV